MLRAALPNWDRAQGYQCIAPLAVLPVGGLGYNQGMRKAKYYSACIGLIGASVAWAVVARHDVADEKLVELGAKFTAVGQVLPDGVGTLIAPNWVLTTSHVATLIPKNLGIVRFEGKEYGVAKVIMHPHSTLGPDEPPEIDIALLLLGQEVKGVTPMALYRDKDEVDQKVAIVGFGEVGDGKSKSRRPADSKRRAVTNVVAEANPLRIVCSFDQPPEGTELEGVSAPGDGGAPALIRKDDAWLVAGLSSPHQEGSPGQYGVMNGFTRVSTFTGWIEKIIADHK